MEIRPTRGKMLAEIIEPENQTASGLQMVRIKKHIPDRAKVLAVGISEIGKKGKEIKPFAETGNVVYIKKRSGDRIKIEGRDLIFLRNEHIIGKA